MSITKKEVAHIATLSQIRLNAEETEQMQAHLTSVLAMYAVIDGVDTGDTPPTAHILPGVNVFREDEAVLPDRDALLASAPLTDGESYIVPAVLE